MGRPLNWKQIDTFTSPNLERFLSGAGQLLYHLSLRSLVATPIIRSCSQMCTSQQSLSAVKMFTGRKSSHTRVVPGIRMLTFEWNVPLLAVTSQSRFRRCVHSLIFDVFVRVRLYSAARNSRGSAIFVGVRMVEMIRMVGIFVGRWRSKSQMSALRAVRAAFADILAVSSDTCPRVLPQLSPHFIVLSSPPSMACSVQGRNKL